MVYKVNYDSLDAMCSNITRQASDWNTEIEKVSTASQKLIQSSNMTGNGADAIREYMTNVHQLLQGLICEALSLHASNVVLYFDDYQVSVDSALHTRIDSDELNRLREELENTKNRAIDIDDELAYQLGRISDIFSVNYRDASGVAQSHQVAIDRMKKLDENVCTLEMQHQSKDFVYTGNLITSLTALIKECLSIQRGGQSNFTVEQLANSKSFQAVYAAHLSASGDLAEKSALLQSAIDRQNERNELLYEERQAQVEKQKWILTGVCVIGSVVAIATIVATGGAATPLVVATVSGVSGAVGAAGNSALDQYVVNGSFENLDWNEIGKDAIVGGVTGFATGYIGAGVSGAITKSVANTTIGSTLLSHSNAAVRIGTGAVIGSASEVGAGIVSRGADTMLRTGDVGEAFENALDGRSMVTDAVIGGVSGGYGEYQKTKPDYIDWENTSNSNEEIELMKQMEADGDFEIDGYDYGPVEIDPTATGPADPSRRMATENSGTIIGNRETGNFEFIPDSDTARDIMAKYGQETIRYSDEFPEFKPFTKHQSEWGEVDCEVKVGYMSEHRPSNYSQADEALAAKISADTGTTVTAAEIENYRKNNRLTWHEVEDRETMQLVPRDIHDSARHRGGVSQAKYEMGWGDVSIDDGSSLVLPRADAARDMLNNIIQAAGDSVKEFPKITTPEYQNKSANLHQLIDKIHAVSAG